MGGRVMRLKIDDIVDQSKAEGMAEGINEINDMNEWLSVNQRMDDLMKSFTDKVLQSKLLDEYRKATGHAAMA